jgi:hypothetical protein
MSVTIRECLTDKGLSIEGNQQWTDLFGSCNWYDFTLIKIEGEYDTKFNVIELDLSLLGFYIGFRYCLGKTEFAEEMQAIVADIMDDDDPTRFRQTKVMDIEDDVTHIGAVIINGVRFRAEEEE